MKTAAQKGKARREPGLSKTAMSEQDNQMITKKTPAQARAALTQRKSAYFARVQAGIDAAKVAEERTAAALTNDAIYNAMRGAA